MKQRTKFKKRFIMQYAVCFLIAFSGIMKLSAPALFNDHYAQMGVQHLLPWLGVIEILCALLFMSKHTTYIALILLSGYFGGAIATELSHGNPFIAPLCMLLLVWIAASIRDPAFFMINQKSKRQSGPVSGQEMV